MASKIIYEFEEQVELETQRVIASLGIELKIEYRLFDFSIIAITKDEYIFLFEVTPGDNLEKVIIAGLVGYYKYYKNKVLVIKGEQTKCPM